MLTDKHNPDCVLSSTWLTVYKQTWDNAQKKGKGVTLLIGTRWKQTGTTGIVLENHLFCLLKSAFIETCPVPL